MTQQNFEIRTLTNDAEIKAYLRIANQAFEPDKDAEQGATAWYQELLKDPSLHAECIRCAFDPESGELLGGYLFWHRHLHVGSITLKTGCIGAVAVATDQRKRGVASALMEEATACAKPHELALIFLTGISDFYHRFGYARVIEDTDIYIERKHIQALSPVETIQIREATVEDAATLLALYEQHYSPFIGSFERTLAQQRYILSLSDSEGRYLLAIDEDQQAVGYLLIHPTDKDVSQREVAATTWPAISALLQEHERRVAASQTSITADEIKESAKKSKSTIRWAIPEEAFIFYHLANHLPFRCERKPYYSVDWMARVGDINLLVKGLLPLWHQRLNDAQMTLPPILELIIDQHSFILTQDAEGIHSTDAAPNIRPKQRVHLTSQAFVQLCFGFRPIAWFAIQSQQTIPNELRPLLEILFPRIPSWVPGSDFF